ncbi:MULTISPECIES: undecaprenyldiphospho-muramoylpentapeptide beta-N-acetylglucosaminyltransferase [unclassified Tatumella]|uniref:undecaprenyldiphospho-muramoylpentapeptide beta-N-acetylglucosaminyltransferase n=1 Tax=unclassified Tatumella TaxID=2649542 RepID=UPI001BAE702A|nr:MULTISPECIES: undecaprenyldiphospho-muramoylpentapeptide beta-N-acetylglucosaminyltransferase [unclassified Tatumella]MBS0856156.1 undecaprenyldiphospho-muramoylpentapeptide beta-N-acetylglucosaminyltransferase [Tatumella sp. JGM16]MBS0877432.1 undecaprenyldiphospho-muramoylpentapeptide beta-N-acetylglucosaminyltransferase [Tatumella sp. JGM82]MBS0891026.1 undecaprenyldiphospho-muramoylpentapeptide beta-N-acetylglucosaminyltransferase [Tatumella sp. JGM94]MBS0895193.1 undecaprenyldiphospho-m
MSGKRLMVMAGGTGGHVFPGLAVAHYLMEQGWQVRWLGTADRMEADLVPKHGIDIDFIRISGLRGKGVKAQLLAPWRIFTAWRQARAIMKAWKPDVVLGMGGYVSGPGGLAAWSCGIPVVLHEQNGIAGLTNKGLSKIASKVMQAFPGAFADAEVVGNPVRTDVLALPGPARRFADREGPIRVLVIGGSQGARILNQTMPQVAEKAGDSITLWHQTGKGALEAVNALYASAGQTGHRVAEFIDDMAEAYAWADVVVCRSGALTVSEIAAAGLPAIFVPFQHKDRQQYWNALPLEKAGAAKIFEQPDFTAQVVAETLAGWDRQQLLAMALKARAIAIPDATERVANEVAKAAG